MVCPKCGLKIELNDQKFCHGCGFDLSKVGKSESTELKRMIDFALKDQSQKTPAAKTDHSAEDKPAKSFDLQSKKQNEPDNQPKPSIITTSHLTDKLQSPNSPVASEKKWKWGMGWIIIAYLFFSPQESKTFESFGTAGELAQIIGCILSLAFYFYLRQRVLVKIERIWLRSLSAGLATYAFVWLLALLSVQILTSIGSVDEKLSELIKTEAQSLSFYLQDFAKKDQVLWANYQSNPKTNQDIRQNISLIQTAIPLYRQKDSLAIATFQKIYFAMLKAPSKDSSAQPYQMQSLSIKAQEVADADQDMLINLLRYNNALLISDPDAGSYLKSFQTASTKYETATQEYATLFKQYFGHEATKNYKEYK